MIQHAIADFEDGVEAYEKTEEQPLRDESDPQLRAIKEMGTLVLQLHGITFYSANNLDGPERRFSPSTSR